MDFVERRERILTESKLVNELEYLKGTSLGYRIREIRSKLLGKLIPQATNFRKYEARDVDIHFRYPNPEQIADLYFRYEKLIEFLYKELKEKSVINEQAIYRFCAIVHSLGIMIHPFNDSNGQTFKLVIQSYLLELLQEAKFLPPRPVREDGHLNNYLFVQFKTLPSPTGIALKIHGEELINNKGFAKDLSDLLDSVDENTLEVLHRFYILILENYKKKGIDLTSFLLPFHELNKSVFKDHLSMLISKLNEDLLTKIQIIKRKIISELGTIHPENPDLNIETFILNNLEDIKNLKAKYNLLDFLQIILEPKNTLLLLEFMFEGDVMDVGLFDQVVKLISPLAEFIQYTLVDLNTYNQRCEEIIEIFTNLINKQ